MEEKKMKNANENVTVGTVGLGFRKQSAVGIKGEVMSERVNRRYQFKREDNQRVIKVKFVIPTEPAKPESPKILKAYLEATIRSGEFARKEIVEKAMKAFPEATRASVDSYITKGKNPKYKPFEKLIVEKDGKLMFEA
jgi:hypothetical protein